MDTDNLQGKTDHGDGKALRQDWRIWGLGVMLVLALILAVGGVIYGWQANANSQLANLNLASAQSAEQDARNAAQDSRHQLATAESAGRSAIGQLAIAQSQVQTALNAQATAESAAQLSATAEAQAKQANESLAEQTRLATSRELAGKALDTLSLDPQLSAHLALQAISTAYTFEAENALHQVLPELHPLMALLGTTGRVPYSPDGTRIALTNDKGYVSIVDIQTGEVQLSWQAYSMWNHNVAWSPDGVRLATVGVDQVDFSHISVNHPVKVWEAATGQLLKEFPGSSYGAIAWSPDGSRVASIQNGYISIWDVASGDELHTLEEGLSGWAEVIFSPDGTKIAIGDAWCGGSGPDSPDLDCDYEVIIWNAVSGNELFRLPPQNEQSSNLSGKLTGLARPVSFALEAERHTSEGLLSWQVHTGWIPDIAFSKGMERAGLSGYDDLPMDWGASAGSTLYEHRSRPSYAYWSTCPSGLAFSPDSQQLAVGVPGGNIILWKLTDSGAVQEGVLTQQGSSAGIDSIAFSPDGTLLGSSSSDGKIRIWDLETGQVRWELAGVGQVVFSPDGTRLISSSDGVTTVHVLPLDELTELVRAHIIRPLTPEECLTYLHQETCPEWP
jgi:WD40 repeat protein